jgi:hypothetical protein
MDGDEIVTYLNSGGKIGDLIRAVCVFAFSLLLPLVFARENKKINVLCFNRKSPAINVKTTPPLLTMSSPYHVFLQRLQSSLHPLPCTHPSQPKAKQKT